MDTTSAGDLLKILDVTTDPSFVDTYSELERRVNRHDPYWIAPAHDSIRKKFELSPDRERHWIGIAFEQNVRATVVARWSPELRDDYGHPIGMLGNFEAENDPAAVRLLLDAAANWLFDQGAHRIVGPMDGSTWARYRFNLGPQDAPPFLGEPLNPAYYPVLWEAAGFTACEEYYSKRVTDLPGAATNLTRIGRRVQEQGYRFRTLQPERFEEELRVFYRLSCEIFAENFLYRPIPWEEFLAMYQPLKPLIDPRFVLFATAPDGADVGFMFAYPERRRAVAAASRRWGKLGYLWHAFTRTINFKSLGVVAKHRRSGLGAALMHEGYARTAKAGYLIGNLCLIRSDNPSGRLDGDVGEVIRHYRLYERSIG
jgi:GNAT superfamily N-acetyltransferase